jgi:hypothetical protein
MSRSSDLNFWSRSIFGIAIFTSAFLLFQVQLLLGKFLLPWFGGTSAIWATCLLFFQVLLLGGYIYAHQIASAFRPSLQGKAHLGFLAITSLSLVIAWYFWSSPVLPGLSWKPAPGAAPILGIVGLLFISVGLPFLLLSSTGPLLQSWYAHLDLSERNKSPYFLYALSNAGSVLGLLSYPFCLEPIFRLKIQSWIWGGGFAVFAVSCAICAWQMRRSLAEKAHPIEENLSPVKATFEAPRRRWLWFFLPMAASIMLLATTNLLTQDVAPIPLLWVLPLCVYLISFVLTFHGPWYWRAIFHPLFAITAALAVISLFRSTEMRITSQVIIFLSLLFSACMVCHGELARIKPTARHLTSFYLLLSMGGAAGGLFVAVIAPTIFPTFWEYQLGLWMTAALLVIVLFLDRTSWLHDSKPDLLIPVGFLTLAFMLPKYLAHARLIAIPPSLLLAYNIGLGMMICLCVWLAFTGGPNWARRRKFRWSEGTLGAGFMLLTAVLCFQPGEQDPRIHRLHRERNFYGAVAVYELWDDAMVNSFYEFLHGRTTHGNQSKKNRELPGSYYGEGSGARLALLTNPQRTVGSMRVGAIGLGIGTLAAYSRPGDVYRFYEINPAVIRIAKGEGGYFTYLSDAAGRIEIVRGDARLSLEEEAARHDFQKFDVLFVDAFNGDSIPVHLLTREAMALYLSHLRGPDSVIVVNATNAFVNLAPVVAALAETDGLKATLIRSTVRTGISQPSVFILLSRGASLEAPEIGKAGYPIRLDGQRVKNKLPLWTDDYSNVATLLVR